MSVNAGEAADVQGVVLGASEDGSYVYFVAEGVLAPGGIAGEDNLYMSHEGKATFVATLAPDDLQWKGLSQYGELAYLPSRVSPSGRFLAFMSSRGLTGYDNRDAVSGERDEEVYLYDARSGRVVCASCDPTGARPVACMTRVYSRGCWWMAHGCGEAGGWLGASRTGRRRKSSWPLISRGICPMKGGCSSTARMRW